MTTRLKVSVIFRDEKKKDYFCNDFPHIGSPWITLYLEGFKREILPSEAIKSISHEFVKEK